MIGTMKHGIEGLIELESTRSQASNLAKRIRKEKGLKAEAGRGHYFISLKDRRAESEGTLVAQRVIQFEGTSDSYEQANQVISDLKGMLRGMRSNGSWPEVTISGVYDRNGHLVYERHRRRHR